MNRTAVPPAHCPAPALALLAACCAATVAAGPVARTSFREVDTLFANPGQGWMSQQRIPGGKPRFPCSVVYLRFDWADAEPEPGAYRWTLLDETIAAWKPHGATVAMRVMTCNAHSKGYYCSPKWLFDAGCKGHDYLVGGDDPTSGGRRIPRIEPDYADPLYLARHGAFLKALGARYDGHPGIEFVDIGSYGIWGEWHTKHPAPVAVRERIVDLYCDAFPKTPLVFMTDDAEVLPHALAKGAGLRRDGVGSPWHEQNWIGSAKYAGVSAMADAWKHVPVVFEWFGNRDYIRARGWSFDAAVAFMLDNHVTLINDNIGAVPADDMPQLEKLARLAGARLVLREIEHEPSLKRGGTLHLRMKWANTGVGKLQRRHLLRVFLLDADGRPLCSADTAADPRAWLPGEHEFSAAVPLPGTVPAGDHKLALGLFDPDGLRRPFRLAIDVPEKDGRHEVGRIRVE